MPTRLLLFTVVPMLMMAIMRSPLWAQTPTEETPAALVRVVSAQRVAMAPTIWVPGTVVSRDDARVGAEVAGQLVWVADIGIRVDRGDALARIDDTELSLEQAQAQAVLVREEARLAYTQQELKRLSELAAKGLVTANRLDEVSAGRDAAAAERGAALARLRLVDDRLRRTRVVAPFGGVVSERFRRAGERVDEGDEILRLVSIASLEVQIRVSAKSLPHLELDSTVRVQTSPDTQAGKVRSIVPVGDDVSRLYDVRLSLAERRWPPGTTVRVAVPTATARTVTAVPRDALVLRREGVFVFRIGADRKAERVSVQTGVASGPLIEVRGDISPGDQVIVRGGERLRPGQALQVLPAGSGPQT